MAFEKYEKGPRRSYDSLPPTVTFRAAQLRFNSTASRLFDSTHYIVLMFDNEALEVGLLPSDQTDPDAFKVAFGPSSAIISAAGFAAKFAIPLRVALPLYLSRGMWVARTDVPDPGSTR